MFAKMEAPNSAMASMGSSSISKALSLKLKISNLDTLKRKINGFSSNLKKVFLSLSVLAISWLMRNSVRSLTIF